MLDAVDAEIGLSVLTSGHRTKAGENVHVGVTATITHIIAAQKNASTKIMVLPKHTRNCTVNSLKAYLMILVLILLFLAINIPPTNTFESRVQPLPGHSNFDTVQYYVTHPARTIREASYSIQGTNRKQHRFVF